jgi:subtilisin family serine protease
MPTDKKKRKKTEKRAKRIPGKDYDINKPIFSAHSDIVAGEVIVQLDESTSGSMSASIPRGPSRGLAMNTSRTFGSPALDDALADLKVRSIVRLHPPAPRTSLAMTAAVELAGTFRVTFDPATSVEDAVVKLAQVDGVQYAEPNRYRETCITPNDTSFAAQWGLTTIHCPTAWDRTTGAPSIVVAVIDTGVDLDHAELAPLLVAGTDMVDLGTAPTAPPGFRFEGDFSSRDSVPQDEVGHGTHVAGTIACSSNNASGVAGVTWNCRIMPVRVLARIVNVANSSDVRGVGSAADIAAGIRWAVDNGARVLNLSLGGNSDTNVERDAIAYAIAHGAVVCAAMGNAGAAGLPSFPGAYPDVVAVGAIDSADRRANFSQVGPHIDVVGPGVGILSTVWDNGFATFSGTSMATPHVAGVAALVLSINPGLTGAQVSDILRQTARPLRDNPADPVPNDNYGFGCVDAAAAVARAAPPIPKTTALACAPSRLVRCEPSTLVRCVPSRLIRCPSVALVCGPSITLRCPSLTICPPGATPVGSGLPPEPGPLAHPSQSSASWGDPGQELEDPYAEVYGDE